MRAKFVLGVSVAGLFALGLVMISSFAVAGQLPLLNGDVDCSGSVTPTDALKILRYDAGLGYDQASNCAPIGSGSEPTPAPGVGMSRDNPVPFGDDLVVPEGWRIRIIDFIPNATQMVLDENQFNDPPQPGFEFAIVRVRMTNVSAENPADPDASFALRMVGSRNVGYTTFENYCGVIPDRFPSNDVFSGGTAEGNICFEVGENESGFAIYTEFFLGEEADTRWFEVSD